MMKGKKKTAKHIYFRFFKTKLFIFHFRSPNDFFGYIVMATGHVTSFQSLTLAPILLFLGYIIFIPIIFNYFKR